MSVADVSMPSTNVGDLRAAIQTALGVSAPVAPAEAPAQPTSEPVAPATEPSVLDPAVAPPEPATEHVAAEPQGEQEIDIEAELDRVLNEEPSPDQPAAEPAADERPPQTRAEAEKEIGALLATSRGRRIYAHHKAIAEIAKPVEEGGIGMEPTADELKAFHQSYVQHSRLIEDMASQDPNAQARVTAWMTEQAPNLVASLPGILAQVNMPLFEQFASGFGVHIAADLRDKAQAMRDPADRERLMDAANLVDFVNGRNPQQAADQGQQQQVSPEVAELRARLARYEQRDQQSQAGMQAQAERRASGMFYQEIEKQITTDVDKVFSMAKNALDDVTFRAYRNNLLSEMRQTVRGALQRNEVLKIATTRAIRDAAASGNQEALKRAVLDARRAYLPKLNEEGSKYIRAAGVRAKQASDTTTAKLQITQNKVEPSPTAPTPTASSALSPAPQQRQGESMDDYRRRMIHERLSMVTG